MYLYMNPTLSKSVNRINLNLLIFGKASVDPDWHGKVMSPVFSRLYYISKGSFVIRADKEYTLEQGNWYLIPAGYSFDYECSETMEHFYFHIKLCDFDGTDLLSNYKNPLAIDFNKFDLSLIEECISSEELLKGLELKKTILEILLSFINKYNIKITSEDYSPCIHKALTYIKQNLSMKLTISEIAESIFVSKSTLTKHFRKELSISVNEYICKMVISESERLLSTTNIPVLDISQRLGFSDQFYFSKKFKEYFGKSPREYRKNRMI